MVFKWYDYLKPTVCEDSVHISSIIVCSITILNGKDKNEHEK